MNNTLNNVAEYIPLYQQSDGMQMKCIVGGKRTKVIADKLGHKLNREDAIKAFNLYKQNKPIPKYLKTYIKEGIRNYNNTSLKVRIKPIGYKGDATTVADKTFNVGSKIRGAGKDNINYNKQQFDVSHTELPASKGGDATNCVMERSSHNMRRGNNLMTGKEKAAIKYDEMKRANANLEDKYGKKFVKKIDKSIDKFNKEQKTVQEPKKVKVKEVKQQPKTKTHKAKLSYEAFASKLQVAIKKAHIAGITGAIIGGIIAAAWAIFTNYSKYLKGTITPREYVRIITKHTLRGVLSGYIGGFIFSLLGSLIPGFNEVMGLLGIVSMVKILPEVWKVIQETIKEIRECYHLGYIERTEFVIPEELKVQFEENIKIIEEKSNARLKELDKQLEREVDKFAYETNKACLSLEYNLGYI